MRTGFASRGLAVAKMSSSNERMPSLVVRRPFLAAVQGSALLPLEMVLQAVELDPVLLDMVSVCMSVCVCMGEGRTLYRRKFEGSWVLLLDNRKSQ